MVHSVARLHRLFRTLHLGFSVSKYVDQKGLAAILGVKRLAGIAPEVKLKIPLCAGDEACEQWIHPGSETQGRHHQKS